MIASLLPVSAGADECIAATGARIHASAFGDYGFILTFGATPTNRARGELFTHRPSGDRRSIWRRELVNVPARLYVSNNGEAVVTVDAMCRSGFEHSLVVYGAGGRLLADYGLEELLNQVEIRDYVKRSISSRLWTEGARFDFDMKVPEFVISLPWGRQIRIDLATGRIVQ